VGRPTLYRGLAACLPADAPVRHIPQPVYIDNWGWNRSAKFCIYVFCLLDSSKYNIILQRNKNWMQMNMHKKVWLSKNYETAMPSPQSDVQWMGWSAVFWPIRRYSRNDSATDRHFSIRFNCLEPQKLVTMRGYKCYRQHASIRLSGNKMLMHRILCTYVLNHTQEYCYLFVNFIPTEYAMHKMLQIWIFFYWKMHFIANRK